MKYFDQTKLTSFQSRYGMDVPDNDYPTNAFVEKMLTRRTIRRFESDIPINPKLIEKLIAVAQGAPTSSMLQPWSVITVKSKEGRDRLLKEENLVWFEAEATKKEYDSERRDPPHVGNIRALRECDTFLLWLVDYTITDAVLERADAYINNPELLQRYARSKKMSREFDMESRAITDTVIAAQTFCVAAESLGIGVMYMGSIRNLELEDFNIPDRCHALFGMCIGWPKPDLDTWGQVNITPNQSYIVKPRLPQELIHHKECYQNSRLDKLDDNRFEKVKEYNKTMIRFYKWHWQSWDWFNRVVNRLWGLDNKFLELLNMKNIFKKQSKDV